MRPLHDIFDELPSFDELIDAIIAAPEPVVPDTQHEPLAIATARFGTRVYRCIGLGGVSQVEAAMQLDLAIEFVRYETRLRRHTPRAVSSLAVEIEL